MDSIQELVRGDTGAADALDDGPERSLRHPGSLSRWLRRGKFLGQVRGFFEKRGFMEVETPLLVTEPGTDPAIDAFEVASGNQQRHFMHTSPELSMKRWIAAGVGAIFQISRVFRRGDLSALHNPEFTMVEWYRTSVDYRVVMSDVEELIGELLGDSIRFAGRGFSLRRIPRVSVREAFLKATGVDLGVTVDGQQLAAALRERGLEPGPSRSFDEVFFRMVVERIEPWLARFDAVFLVDYPSPVASLARRVPGDSRFAERFELFVAGMEIANGYSELTDPVEQEARFQAEEGLRAERNMAIPPVPVRFLASLRLGLPDCAGVSVGLDRLFMLHEDVQDIDDVLPFRWASDVDRPAYRPLDSGMQ